MMVRDLQSIGSIKTPPIVRKAGQGVESGELSGYSVIASNKSSGKILPHIVVQSTTPLPYLVLAADFWGLSLSDDG